MIVSNVHWTWSFDLFIASWGARARGGSSWCCELQYKLGCSGKGWVILMLLAAEQWLIYLLFAQSSSVLLDCNIAVAFIHMHSPPFQEICLWVLVLQPWSGEEGLRWPMRVESCVTDTCYSCSQFWNRQRLTKTLSKSCFSWFLTWLALVLFQL